MTRPTASEGSRVVDSSVWIEHLSGGARADVCRSALSDESLVITPAQVLYEVYRWTRRHCGESVAMEVVGHMEYTRLVPGDVTVAIVAVDVSLDHGLSAADAVVYATARLAAADLVTLDADFRGLPGVTLLGE